jgi:DNA-binding NtrC family response regulator
MTRANSRSHPARFSVAVVTTDHLVGPEADEYLAQTYDLQSMQTWDELAAAMQSGMIHAVLLDLDTLGDTADTGIAALRSLRGSQPDLLLVALTRSNSRSLRMKAIEATADEYFVAPVDFQELQIILARALEKRMTEIEYRAQKDMGPPQPSFAGLIGLSEPMQLVYSAIRRVADSTSTILIRGESGTGKELVAQAIVALSSRADKPFISINCAALPDNLIEAELFGHERGAFTDAHAARVGHIELADRGTLFLDEIGTLGLPLQSKLLRVLEDRAVRRIGGKTAKKIDFRLITATNEDLEQMVHAGRFREDLYYRINVVPITLPSLRERQGDIPLLVDHFLRRYCAANKVDVKQVDPEVMTILEEDAWPGNVRELENLVQRLVIMVDGPVIKVHHLPQRILYNSATSQESLLIPENGVNFDQEIARIETAYLTAALRRSGGSKVQAAQLLQIDKQKMHYLCRKYRIGRD